MGEKNESTESTVQYNQLRKVTVASDNMEAEIIISILDSSNITAHKTYDSSGEYMNIYMGSSMQGVNILVGEEDYEDAMEIVAGIALDGHETIMSDGSEVTKDMDHDEIEAEMIQVEADYKLKKNLMRIIIGVSVILPIVIIILFYVYSISGS
ncbi:MAG: DUF2007 domain-containing protein [Vallitaleaceae bacterium]|jgi:CHASE3 domain sensor protein|nr:DUF2007 domain-containing protein [Vallitaleaceae bacterium]